MVTLQRLSAWDNLVPEWVEPAGATWLSRGARIFRAVNFGAAPVYVATVPTPAWKRLVTRNPLIRRLLRFNCYNVIPLGDGRLFVSFDNSVFLHERGEWTEIAGLARQFRILRGCCALTPNGDLFFGEYFSNADRKSALNIYRMAAGAVRAEIVWTFAPGEIRHIHGLHWDAYESALWICTGDLPNECRLLKTKDDFRSLTTVGSGDESWRTLFPLFSSDSIFYATDSEFRANFIYRINRADGQRETITEIDGPSYYGTQVDGAAIFATTVELCPSQKGSDAVIWAVDAGRQAKAIVSYPKDLFGSRRLIPLFQAGIVLFAAGCRSHSATPFTGSGLAGLGGRMFAISVGAD